MTMAGKTMDRRTMEAMMTTGEMTMAAEISAETWTLAEIWILAEIFNLFDIIFYMYIHSQIILIDFYIK